MLLFSGFLFALFNDFFFYCSHILKLEDVFNEFNFFQAVRNDYLNMSDLTSAEKKS